MIQPNAPTGYTYVSTFRDSSTGAFSVPGPFNRYSLNPLREDVVVTPATTAVAGIDYCDIYREGGTITDYDYVGSVLNNNGNPNSLNDGLSDETAASNPTADLTQLQPWPVLGIPWTGVCNVVGTTVEWVSGTPFNTALVNNSVILINGTAYETYGHPHSASFLEILLDAGALTNAAFSIQSPTLAGQPLPIAFGPLEGPFVPVVFAVGDPINAGTLYFSNPGNFDSASDQNTLDLCGPSDPLITGETWNGLIFAGSRNDVYVARYSFLTALEPGSAPYQFQRIPSPSGFWSPWAICRGPDGVYALGRDGIYRWTDAGGISITDEQLYPLFPHDGQPGGEISADYAPVDMTQTSFMRLSCLTTRFGLPISTRTECRIRCVMNARRSGGFRIYTRIRFAVSI